MPDLLTAREAKRYLKVSRATLWRFMLEGRLKWVEIEGYRGRRFRQEDLDQLIREGKGPRNRT